MCQILAACPQDAVPKALMHFLVNTVQRGLQQHLIRTLYREELFGELMNEREDVAIKRQQCQEVRRAALRFAPACNRGWGRGKRDNLVWSRAGSGGLRLVWLYCELWDQWQVYICNAPGLHDGEATRASSGIPFNPSCFSTNPSLVVQGLRALRQALATLEGLPGELVGRVNASGKWSFKHMLSPEKNLIPGGGRAALQDGSPTKAPYLAAAAAGPAANGGGSSSLLASAAARRPATAGQLQGPPRGGAAVPGAAFVGSPR
jgi:hypothetical protein